MNILFYYRGRESLGIEYLSGVLKKAGHKVDMIFDPGLDDNCYWKNRVLKIFQNEELMIEKAQKFSPHLLAFSSVTNDYQFVKRMAHRLKKRLKVPIIVGGIHATSLPNFVLSNPDVDMVCRGEGELALLELVNRMSEGKDFYGTRNIWFKKKNGTIVRNGLRPLIEDLDSLPFPDKDLFYKYGCFRDYIMVISGRGCPFSCTYCHNSLLQKIYEGKGKYVRRRSVDNLILELKLYKEKYKAKEISFQDDIFVMNRDWLKEFSYSYVKEIGLPFFCNVFPSFIDEETLHLLKQSRCKDLFMGIDAGDESMRKNVLKRNTPEEDIRRSTSIIKKHNIPLELSIIFGWPGETSEDMWKTVKLIRELSPNWVLAQILYPFPNTAIYKYCREIGLINDDVLLRIFNGEESVNEESILDLPHKDLAYVISKLLPLYIRVPSFLKPIVKALMNRHIKGFVNKIFVLTIFFPYTHRAIVRLKEFILMALISLKKRFEVMAE